MTIFRFMPNSLRDVPYDVRNEGKPRIDTDVSVSVACDHNPSEAIPRYRH